MDEEVKKDIERFIKEYNLDCSVEEFEGVVDCSVETLGGKVSWKIILNREDLSQEFRIYFRRKKDILPL